MRKTRLIFANFVHEFVADRPQKQWRTSRSRGWGSWATRSEIWSAYSGRAESSRGLGHRTSCWSAESQSSTATFIWSWVAAQMGRNSDRKEYSSFSASSAIFTCFFYSFSIEFRFWKCKWRGGKNESRKGSRGIDARLFQDSDPFVSVNTFLSNAIFSILKGKCS